MLNKPIITLVVAVAGIYVILHLLDNNLHILPIDPHIKQLAWTIFLISGAVLLYIYLGTGKKPLLPNTTVVLPGEQVKETSILDYGSNRIGDIDKCMIVYNGQETWLHFPPHVAKFVMSIAPKNSKVDVNFDVINHTAADGKPMYNLTAVKSISAIFIVASVQPPAPASGKSIEITSPVLTYKNDEHGAVSGFVMDKYIIELPKHISLNIAPMLKKATDISVKGYERNPGDGFINTTGLVLVKPYAITIDKTNYLL